MKFKVLDSSHAYSLDDSVSTNMSEGSLHSQKFISLYLQNINGKYLLIAESSTVYRTVEKRNTVT